MKNFYDVNPELNQQLISYIKPNQYYDLPTNWQIAYASYKYKIENRKANRDLIKEASLFFSHQLFEEKDYVKEEYTNIETIEDTKKREWVEMKHALYSKLEGKYVYGVSPLNQAVTLVQALLEQNEDLSKMTSQDMDKAIELMTAGQDEITPELVELVDTNKRKFDPFQKINFKTLNEISLLEHLGAEFKVQKRVEEKEVLNGLIPSSQLMKRYDQLEKTDLVQFLYPDFDARLATKNLRVNIKTDKTEHKQKIIIIIDRSGSMDEEIKQKWVGTLLIDRLRYVIKEEAELFIAYYEKEVEKMHHLYNRSTAVEFWRNYSFVADGGLTALGSVITKIKNEVASGDFFNLGVDLREEDVEVLAINDGQDRWGVDITTGFPYKTNAISLMDGENQSLKELCIQNEGKYIYIDESGISEFTKKETKKSLFKQ